ncbi:DEAD/DEAH box helicase [Persicobacter psychrovividus]|uniref:ATP-dependent RNA helicase RhlE n=1 Tax=Persicobacter psychrovividus TaxID=387638 RepID=A0ABN6LCX3_9BACT|nr:ATP-dependent RNA helicase RhlE [Persicobacter psychrovividus]
MKFENYHISPLLKKSLSKMGYKRPTDIQYKSIPPILRGEDILAIAQTGTGKTAAFAIPVINMLQDRKINGRPDGVRCVVMVPTRELAQQVAAVFTEIGRHTRVKTMCLFGGVEQEAQVEQLAQGVDVVVATPGRFFDLQAQRHLDLRRVEILVLDEADHMLDLGFIKDMRDVISRIPKRRQTLFFSATINEKIKDLAYGLVNKAVRIQISPKDPVSKNVTHSVAFVAMDDKRFFLERLIKEHEGEKMLVFVRTKVRAERVMKAMERVGIKSATLHGGKDQKEREETMKSYRSGELKILIATDISARGIDVAGVEYVVNYDLPELSENYVHRVGRTGRAKEKGYAISFCAPEEEATLKEIESFLNKEIKVFDIDPKDYSTTVDFSGHDEENWQSLMKMTNLDDMTGDVFEKPKKAPKKSWKDKKKKKKK